MTEISRTENIETEMMEMDSWIQRLSESKLAPELDRMLLRTVLEKCGAKFEISPELLATLSRKNYTNALRSEAIKTVWGSKYEGFIGWTKEYITDYERKTGTK